MPALRSGTAAALVAALFLLSGVVMLLESHSGAGAMQSRLTHAMGPAFFPRIVLLLILPMALAAGIAALREGGTPVRMQRAATVLGMMAATGLYVWLISAVGFLFASMAYSVACPLLLGYRNPRWLLSLAILYSVAAWFMFHRVLKIILPGSPWFDYF